MTDDRPDAIQRFQQSGFSYPFRITQPVEALLALRTTLGLPTVGRALVFGCSGGEEVLTVAALLPDAEILGCDVDEEALRLAGSSLRLPHARVVRSDWGAIRDNGPYGLITCNAVLCLHPQDTKIDDISAALPFGRIDEILHGLLGVLAPGGVLFAGDCNYPPGLSHAAKALWPVSLRGFNGNHEGVWSGTVERYGADGRKFATRFLSPRLIAFPGFRAVRPMPLDLEAAMLDRAWLRPPYPPPACRPRWPGSRYRGPCRPRGRPGRGWEASSGSWAPTSRTRTAFSPYGPRSGQSVARTAVSAWCGRMRWRRRTAARR